MGYFKRGSLFIGGTILTLGMACLVRSASASPLVGDDAVLYACADAKPDGSLGSGPGHFAIVDHVGTDGNHGLYVRATSPNPVWEQLFIMSQELDGDQYSSDSYDVSIFASVLRGEKDRARIYTHNNDLVADCQATVRP